jgi:hypothetical protein
MPENFESKFGRIDELLSEVEQSTGGGKLLAEIDELCGEINVELESRRREIAGWPLERKRQEAADSSDPFVLNLLSMDGNFNVRTLSACNPNAPEASLRRLAENTTDYIRMVIANNPNAPSDILDRIAEISREQEVLDAVEANQNVSAVTKYKIENRM